MQNDQLLNLLPGDVDDNTKKLVGRLLVAHKEQWRKDAFRVSGAIVPQLREFNWSVNLKVHTNKQKPMYRHWVRYLKIFFFLLLLFLFLFLTGRLPQTIAPECLFHLLF
jgi:hypothetical protein